jgi:methylenetetrahydrofolate dehydrogenase (NADP+)/methenyltetrahydrofolate cyclohydrolase
VIDVGISFVEVNGESVMSGDVQFNEETLQKVRSITQVPGGVGPMTVTMLMCNLVESWELQN